MTVSDRCQAGGLLAVVVEADDGDSFRLQLTRRFAHSAAYLRRQTQASGFSELENVRSFLRKQAEGDCIGATFVFFSSHPKHVKEPYLRYLENRLRENFDFSGVPITIFFREK